MKTIDLKDNGWLKDKTILVTGGTGSFGNAALERFLGSEVKEIRIFSRDEKKQDDLRNKYKSCQVSFFLGDVRCRDSVKTCMKGVDLVFHAAALKQVPSCEFFPAEAVKTNIEGAKNVIDAAIRHDVQKVVCLSTDKAVYPINAMGMTKALMEKVAVAMSRNSCDTDICITRYGNVMASRGSVIPLFLQQTEESKKLTITDPSMTRFMMSLSEAVDLVIFAFRNSSSGDIFVRKSPASNIEVLAKAVLQLKNRTDLGYDIIGTRHGEKLYEVLCSREEMAVAEDLGEFFKIPADNRGLDYGVYFDRGNQSIAAQGEYNSHNTVQLDVDDVVQLLKSLNLSK